MNKKTRIVFATLLTMVPVLSSGQALASVHHKMIQKEIDLNGQAISKPSGFTYDKTTYMPIWYVMSALKHLGIQSTWDGTNWKITTPASEQPDLTNIKVGSGSMNIYINGKLAKKVVGIADIDPASKNATMFMPVWYVMQILKTIAVDPTWDGTKWNMDTANNLTDYAPQDIVYLADQYMTNLNATDDIVQLTQDLYQSGFVTNNFVTSTQKEMANRTWAQFATKGNITSEAFVDSSFTVTQEGEVSPTKIVIEASETDTNTFTNGKTQSVKQVNDWMLIKDSVSGLWQIEGLYTVSQDAVLGMDGTVLTPAVTNQSLFTPATPTNPTNPPAPTNQVAPANQVN
ncbi:MAG: hypothetical protein A2201_00790 [Alicyclobacillus sp. RIFOXYA1_FULL_53_8]|nr:MAG: hypothetical protein A2201_00790 [Alicyclobacillus sp. RIFOXYA1_FULL_53_8]